MIFLQQHERLEIPFPGTKPVLSICGLTEARVEKKSLFSHLSSDWHPIAINSDRHSAKDQAFIKSGVQQLLKKVMIEHSSSLWRTQVLVSTNERHRRMVVSYSQTINRFTYLDAYPFPRIDKMMEDIDR